MDRRCARIVLALATVAASCPSSDGGGASDVPAEAVQDLAADAAEDTAPDPVADLAPADARKEVGEKPLPPVVAGPPAHLFDCTHDPAKLPGHVSPVPLGCILDDACADVMVTSHRGAGGDFGTIAPQNTLAAIRAAIVMGVDAVELDVRDTKDGRFVLMHDGTVDKTTDGTGAVADMTLDEVRALHPKTDGLLSGGDFGCENVPTLEEAMDLAKDRVWIYLDTKTDKVPELVALIGSKGMLDQVVIASGGTGKAIAARAANPGARVLVWLDSMAEVEQALADVVPPPDVIEVKANAAKAAADLLRPKGVKVAVDAFAEDLRYYSDEDPVPFQALFDAGVRSVQVEFAPQVLAMLGRWAF